MHDGHRERMRKRYLAEGIDNFKDHEVLEMLLYNVIPRSNTNEIAHNLLNEFGSFSKVLDADVKRLTEVDGVGKNTAYFLNMIPSFFRLYSMSKCTDSCKSLTSVEDVGKFVAAMFKDKKYEEFAIICLDSHKKVTFAGSILKGTINETPAYPRVVVTEVLKHNAQNVILAHNHPSGSLVPSSDDRATTNQIITALESISINVIDHIIVSGDKYISLVELGMI